MQEKKSITLACPAVKVSHYLPVWTSNANTHVEYDARATLLFVYNSKAEHYHTQCGIHYCYH